MSLFKTTIPSSSSGFTRRDVPAMPGMPSSSSAQFVDVNKNPLGGLLDDDDTIPSAILMVFYILCSVVFVLRAVTGTARMWIMWRPAAFVGLRIATWALRLRMSMEKSLPGKDAVAAEIVLLLLGPVFLLSPTLSLFKDAADPYAPPADDGGFLRFLFLAVPNFLQGAAISVTVLSILAGAKLVKALDLNADAASSFRLWRDTASYILVTIAVILFLLLVVAWMRYAMRGPRPGSPRPCGGEPAKLLAISALVLLLLCLCFYRAIQSRRWIPTDPINTKTVFYIVYVAPEASITALLVSFNWNTLVPAPPREAAYVGSTGAPVSRGMVPVTYQQREMEYSSGAAAGGGVAQGQIHGYMTDSTTGAKPVPVDEPPRTPVKSLSHKSDDSFDSLYSQRSSQDQWVEYRV